MALASLYFSSAAQSRWNLSDLYFIGGASATSTPPLNTWEINNLEKNLFEPSTLKSSLYGRQSQRSNVSSRYNGHMGMMAGWTLRGSRLGQQKIRVGLSAGAYSLNWGNNYRSSEDYRIDTLVSQQTGESYYIDSTHTRNLYYEHLAQMLNLHFDYLVYINPQNKLTFYTGAGARFGISLNNTVSSTYHEYGSVNEPGYLKNEFPKFGYDFKESAYLTETKKLSPATSFQAHAIVGANYRLSKRNRFLKRINLFHEFNMGIQAINMEGIESSIGFNAGFQSGLRLSLNKRKAPRKNTYEKTRRKRY